jgi:tetratricopeptide (TPR) repeat protein
MFRPLALIVALGAVFLLSPVGPASARDGIEEVVKRFASHLESLSGVDETLRKEINEVLSVANDDYSVAEAITSSLARIYPDYEKAIMGMSADDPLPSLEMLETLSGSEDPFLAADASFLLARLLMNDERHEQALVHLERLLEKLSAYTVHSGPSCYFAGMALASMLDNQGAISALKQFLEGYPDAPERLRVSAWRQLQELSAIEEGQLSDVLQRMEYSRRRLQIGETDKPTQTEQDRIVKMLQTMIEEEEKKECSSCNSQSNSEQKQEAQGEGEGEGDSPGKSDKGGSSNNPNGTAKRNYQDGPASPWSILRERTRDAANNAIKQRLPVRYRNVVERYYESISGNEKGDE